MKLHLSCSKDVHKELEKLILNEGYEIDSEGSIALVERNHQIPDHKVCILFDACDVQQAFDLVKNRYREDVLCPSNNLLAPQGQQRLVAYHDNKYVLLNTKEVLYINVSKTEVTCITDSKICYLKEPLYHYEEKLKHKDFIRINKSQLVNLLNVKEIIPWFNSRLVLVMKNDIRLEVSKMYAKLLRNLLGI